MTKLLTVITSIAVSVTASAAVADTTALSQPTATVNDRISIHESLMWQMTPESYTNPAIKQWMLPVSYSTLGAIYRSDRENEAIDLKTGKGTDYWGIEADSYIKYKSSTLWGTASYHNGYERGMQWNETSDPELVYPYFLADAIGGDMHMEQYSFSGGYADHSDCWAWGATISYEAGLYYRNVDPRPRNVTSNLNLSAGAAYRLSSTGYQAGVSVNYRKYKQTGDLDFVNEMSDNKAWHLTGLGTHYERFASQGYNHYYNGYRWGATADLFPSRRHGAVVSVGASSFKFDHILTSFNKLPLQSVTHNELTAMAGWLNPGTTHDWSATATLTAAKRSGNENIFGDPASNVYPQIGSLKLYTHSLTTAAVNFLWQWHHTGGSLLAVNPSIGYSHSREAYLDPQRHLQLSALTPSVTVKGCKGFGADWRASLEASFAYSIATDCSADLPVDTKIPAELQQTDIHRYDVMSRNHYAAGVRASAYRSLSDRYAITLSAAYRHTGYRLDTDANLIDISASFVF